jgi:MraZ protein
MLLTGSYRRSLDDKQRLALPKQIRDILGPLERLFVTPGTDRSLAVYSEARLSELGSMLAKKSPAAEDVKAFSRLFYARAIAVEIDRQGRIRIPPELANTVRIGSEVMLVGVGDHLELWELGIWEAFVSGALPRFDEIAAKAFASGTESE